MVKLSKMGGVGGAASAPGRELMLRYTIALAVMSRTFATRSYGLYGERSNQKKLVNINGGQIKHQPTKGYINLTKKVLTPDQEELLNFGLNCLILS
ncbi:hypothetical protein Pcinc_011882 [Petrolisthes cinctipes]|uniref:Uncharacterized protein n=1 Tax=Petrolisthes cinctipes TaxID=88211 RepID=A0AAE1G1S2_PETCI|nr:hypothetical protein Pcinc_011882 [Petrolisthes cinctipes]